MFFSYFLFVFFVYIELFIYFELIAQMSVRMFIFKVPQPMPLTHAAQVRMFI